MAIRNRESLKKQLVQRSQESHEKLDDSGRFGSYFKKGVEGFKQWKCGESEHVIDIVPWEIGSHYPTRNYPNVKKGQWAYVLDIWVHYNIGPNEDSYVCPARNYGLECPVCEHINELRKVETPDDELIKEKIPRRRSVYNIVCMDSDAEEDKGVQVWDVAHFFMEKHLAERAKKPRGGGHIVFADPEEGKQVYFKRKGTGRTSTEFTNHQFLDRDYEISDEIVEAALCLDEIINVPTYEELYKAYWGRKKGDEEQDAEPEPETEQETGEDAEPEPETEKPTRRRTRRTPPKEEVKEDTTNDKCPAGGVFGVDIDKLDACVNCGDLWDDCAAENDRLEDEKKKKEKGTTRRRRSG